jgi:hypothetical protein
MAGSEVSINGGFELLRATTRMPPWYDMTVLAFDLRWEVTPLLSDLYALMKSLPLRFLGWCDYYLRNTPREVWQGAFNNQEGRQRIFRNLVTVCGFSAIVETGTFRGDTTQYMHEHTQLPVYSVDVDPRSYSFARARLRRCMGIRLYCMDSVEFLKLLWAGGLAPKAGVFFYLDAHWYDRLPLKEEVGFIFDHWPDAVVMIDDFQVPGDEGYAYDHYGHAGALSLSLIAVSLAHHHVRKWFPSLASEDETGAQRGVVVLAKDPSRCAILGAVATLREYPKVRA